MGGSRDGTKTSNPASSSKRRAAAQQEDVLKDAAAEHDRVEARESALAHGGVADQVGDPLMESTGDLTGVDARAQVGDDLAR